MNLRYSIKPGKHGLYYVGASPTGAGHFLSITLGQLTEAELAAWVQADPATASRYIDQTTISSEPTKDKQPATGQPAPASGKRKKKG